MGEGPTGDGRCMEKFIDNNASLRQAAGRICIRLLLKLIVTKAPGLMASVWVTSSGVHSLLSVSKPDSDVRPRAVITASSTLPGSVGSGRWRGSGSGVLCLTQQLFANLSAPVPSLYVTWPHLAHVYSRTSLGALATGCRDAEQEAGIKPRCCTADTCTPPPP